MALGREGLRVPRLGYGCFNLTGIYGPVERGAARRTIQRAVELGLGFLDTADVYGPFTNEELIGEAIAGVRECVVLATKFGNIVRADGSRVLDGSPAHARRACEDSLRRLGVEVIDLYYLHRVDRSVPIEETVGAMGELVAEGKVRYLGLSEASAVTIRRAHATHPLTALQSEYSLWERNLEAEILPTLRELGIGLVAFSPLGRGMLSGSVRSEVDLEAGDARRTLPRFMGADLRRNVSLLTELEQLAEGRAVTLAQLALAWVLAQGFDVVPIPGTRSIEHLEENAEALAVALPQADIEALARVMPPGAAAGERYPPDFMARLDGQQPGDLEGQAVES